MILHCYTSQKGLLILKKSSKEKAWSLYIFLWIFFFSNFTLCLFDQCILLFSVRENKTEVQHTLFNDLDMH